MCRGIHTRRRLVIQCYECNITLPHHTEPSNPPQSVTINNDDTTSLVFVVEPPVVPNGVITAYTYYITFENGSSTVLVDRSLTGTFTLEGLLPYQLVTVEVSANTSAGEGPKSPVDEIRTSQAGMSIPLLSIDKGLKILFFLDSSLCPYGRCYSSDLQQ